MTDFWSLYFGLFRATPLHAFRPLVCDECGKRLGFRKGWFHCVGDVFDLCKRDYELLGDEDKKDATYKRVLQKDDLAGDLTMYAPELHRQALREEAIVRFKEVGLAYKVSMLKCSLYSGFYVPNVLGH
jgi:hypothetical protein